MLNESVHDWSYSGICKVKISEANTNGTLQVTIPARAAEALNWKPGDILIPVVLKGCHNGERVPFAITYHKEGGTNGLTLGHRAVSDKNNPLNPSKKEFIFETEEAN